MLTWNRWSIMFIELLSGQRYDISCWDGHVAVHDSFPIAEELPEALA